MPERISLPPKAAAAKRSSGFRKGGTKKHDTTNNAATTKKAVHGIYVPRADDEDYYRVDMRDLTTPQPPEDLDLEKTEQKTSVDRWAVYYKPTAGCLTKYFPTRRSAYVDHLVRQMTVNSAKVVISEHPDIVAYPLTQRTKSAPVKTEDRNEIEPPKRIWVRPNNKVPTVTPAPPPRTEIQTNGLLGSYPLTGKELSKHDYSEDSKHKRIPAVETSLPEMPSIRVRLTWNTPRTKSPDNGLQVSLLPENTDQLLAETQAARTLDNQDIVMDSPGRLLDSPRIARELGLVTVEAEPRPSLELLPVRSVDPVKARQFRPLKSRQKERVQYSWKEEKTPLPPRPATSADVDPTFLKLNRPSRLHPRDFRLCGAHRPDMKRMVMTSQSHVMGGQCVLCQCGLEWSSLMRSGTTGVGLPAV